MTEIFPDQFAGQKLKYAISHYSIPTPSQDPKDYDIVFSLEDFNCKRRR
jgi:hypothetical protein